MMLTENLPWLGSADMATVMGTSRCPWLNWRA